MTIPHSSQYMPIVERALEEDIGRGDITTQALKLGDVTCEGSLAVREDGIIAGLFIAKAVFEKVDPDIELKAEVDEGALTRKDTVIATLRGRAESILAGERVALNFLQRMSGIATFTYQFARAVAGTKTVIKDTRKTAPGLRILEKYAVTAGGGKNHRFCLDDAVLIKDNHIEMAGGVASAVNKVRENVDDSILIEVETGTMDEVREALEAKADIIMLDNMKLLQIEEAVGIIDGRATIEVSGNASLLTVGDYAELGVDIVSVGALTHSPDALDIGLDFHPV